MPLGTRNWGGTEYHDSIFDPESQPQEYEQPYVHVLLHEVEARQPSTVLFAPPTSLPRVVCVMNQIHWG